MLIMLMDEIFFAPFVRTKTLFKQRLKDLKRCDSVRVCTHELDKLGVNNGPLLWRLKMDGEMSCDSRGCFKAL